MKKRLQRIYKANQCADTVDAQIALSEVKNLQSFYGHSPALTKREISLLNRLKRLNNSVSR